MVIIDKQYIMNKQGKIPLLFVGNRQCLNDTVNSGVSLEVYRIIQARNSFDALELFKKNDVDLCVIDADVAETDGFSLALQLRMLCPDIPVIFLIDGVRHSDMLRNLDLRIDDYVVKPLQNKELGLRTAMMSRRLRDNDSVSECKDEKTIMLGSFVFDTKNLLLIHDGKEQPLTRKEAALLKVLYENKNELVTRKKVLKMIWGSSDYFIGRSMDVFIARLRKYLRADPDVSIVTVHGVGFRLVVMEPVMG